MRCAVCKDEFERRSRNQKYCNERCKGVAYAIRDSNESGYERCGKLHIIQGDRAEAVRANLAGHPQECGQSNNGYEQRRIDCRHYGGCLDYAMVLNWDGFRCGDCFVAPVPIERQWRRGEHLE